MSHGWLFRKKLDEKKKEYKQIIFIKLRSLTEVYSFYKGENLRLRKVNWNIGARIHKYSLITRALTEQQNFKSVFIIDHYFHEPVFSAM